jgi:hypothetical protein
MPAKKPPKPSVEACQRLWASIIINKHLSEERQGQLLRHVSANWPGRPRSVLQEWAYPEIHRLMNGVAIWQIPFGKRFGIVAASKMIAKIIEHRSWKALLTGYLKWKSKRTPQELRVICEGEEEPRL